MRLRYGRWWERVLSVVWPPKRRHLRRLEELLRSDLAHVEADAERFRSDLLLYGSAYMDATGRRIDPTTIQASK